MFLCFELSVAAHEFPFRTQPILNVVAVVPAAQFLELVGELSNRVVCSAPSIARCTFPGGFHLSAWRYGVTYSFHDCALWFMAQSWLRRFWQSGRFIQIR